MLLRILRYVPATVIPAVVSFAIVYVFTRHLTPSEFGDYNFAISTVLVGTSTLFYALPTVVMQMVPSAHNEGRRDGLLRTAYTLLGATLAIMLLATLVAVAFPAVRHSVPSAFWLAIPLTGLRGLVALNQSINQVEDRVGRYSTLECVQSLGGFVIAIALVVHLGPTAFNLILGMTVGALICVLADAKLSLRTFRHARFDPVVARAIIALAMPLVVTFMTGAVLVYSDRFILETLSSAEQLGLYAVALALVDRPLSTLCVTVMTALYPLALQTQGAHGDHAASAQLMRNGLAVISVALPACVGIALVRHPMATVLVGSEFRAGAEMLIPFFAVVVFLRSVSTHILDHIFYLTQRSHLMLAIYLPIAVANVVLSALGAPRYGVYATIVSAIACQIVLIAAEWWASRRIFPLPVRGADLAKIAVATAGMAFAVTAIHVGNSWGGLGQQVLVGGVAYSLLFFAFNILDLRRGTVQIVASVYHGRKKLPRAVQRPST